VDSYSIKNDEKKLIEILSSRDTIRNQLIEYFKEYVGIPEIDFSKTSYLSYLINILSILSSNLMFYNSSVYREFFLIRARQKESVLNISHMLGYNPDIAKPAIVPIVMSIPKTELNHTGVITLKSINTSNTDYFKFFTNDNIQFVLDTDIRIEISAADNVFHHANIRSISSTGVIKEISWQSSDDDKYVVFVLDTIQLDKKVESYKISSLDSYKFLSYELDLKSKQLADVKIYTIIDPEEQSYFDRNGEFSDKNKAIEWAYKESLFLASSEERIYAYRLGSDKIKIFFGNNIVGKQPEPDSLVIIDLRTTNGLSGNIITGMISNCSKIPIIDSKTNKQKYLTGVICTNVVNAVNGKDYQTIDEIRTNTIAFVTSNKRLVTEFDYKYISNIVDNLPVSYALPILKRSDLKRNEICIFSALDFQNQLIPTQSVILKCNNPFSESGSNNIRIKNFTKVEYAPEPNTNIYNLEYLPDRYEYLLNKHKLIDINNAYRTLFDIILERVGEKIICKYYYTIRRLNSNINMKERINTTTDIFIEPILLQFWNNRGSNNTSDKLIVKLISTPVSIDAFLSNKYKISCIMTNTKTDKSYTNTTAQNNMSVGNELIFDFELPEYEIPEDEVIFNFTIIVKEIETTNTVVEMSTWNSDPVILKRDITDIVYSESYNIYKLNEQNPDVIDDDYIIILDVPCIESEYYETISESDELLENFEYSILNKFSAIDMSKYRMMTDNMNLKLSKTTGFITNINYNPITKPEDVVINSIDPTSESNEFMQSIIENFNGSCWIAITNHKNIFDIKDRGFIIHVTYSVADGVYNKTYGNPIKLKINDILYYLDNCNTNDKIKLIYNGENLIPLVQNIPITIELDVWKNKTFNITDSYIIDEVKNSIITSTVDKFGFDSNISISDIETAVLKLDYVNSCKVIKPEFDIFFNYDLQKLQPYELITYSPELVCFNKDNIKVNIRN